ncbi:MAG: HAMP domain-containing histidine kinase [Cyclobacteriaceae bacterium]|nr:HAMP domain-containing histidine kinase [Cyclobacteriaceae bacterium]
MPLKDRTGLRIRTKISLIFTAMTAIVLVLLSFFVYFFNARYTRNDFYNRLRERALITAQAYLEADEASTFIYSDILRKYVKKMPEEEQYFYHVNLPTRRVWSDSLEMVIREDKIDEILNRGYARYAENKKYSYGLLYRDNEGDYVVMVTAEDLSGNRKLNNLKQVLASGCLLSLFFIYFLGRFYADQILRPITKITRRVNEIEASNLHLRMDPGRSNDELQELVLTFNKMLDRLETAFEIQNNFLSHASHELKNPLTAILGEAEIILSRPRNTDSYVASIQSITKEAARLEILTDNLFKLAQASFDGQGLIRKPFRIDEMIMFLKKEFQRTKPDRQIHFNLEVPKGSDDFLTINGFESMFEIALSNLIENACKFSKDEDVNVIIVADKKNISFTVIDKGIGIPEGEVKSVFEPFFRASNVRSIKGFGIGLPLTKKIIELHDGTIDVKSEPNKGTEIYVRIPRSASKKKEYILKL